MIIIKKFGRSVITQDKNTDNKRERELDTSARAKAKSQNSQVFPFLNKKEDFINLWISEFDKLIYKPKGDDKPTKEMYTLREAAGKGFLNYWNQMPMVSKKDGAFSDMWMSKVHPYGRGITEFSPPLQLEKLIDQGLLSAMGGSEPLKNCHWNRVTSNVFKGLKVQLDILEAQAKNTFVIKNKTNSKRNRPASQNIKEFLLTDETAFINLWISEFDKLILKPQGHNKPTEKMYNLRQQAGVAFLNYWKKKPLIPWANSESFPDKWMLKVHPYGDKTSNNRSETLIKSKWGSVMRAKECLSDDQWEQVAFNVYSHLYGNQKTLNGKNKEIGLIAARANSIKQNVPSYTLDKDNNFLSDKKDKLRYIAALRGEGIKWEEVKDRYKWKELTQLINIEEIDSTDIAKRKQHLAECFYTHHGRIFGDIQNSKIEDKDCFLYHSLVKEILFECIEKKQDFLNDTEVHQRLIYKENNRIMATAVSIGKLIHYQGGIEAIGNKEDLVNSKFLTDAGLTEIKQNESFVRQWLELIAIANTTLSQLVDPDGKHEDIFAATSFDDALKGLNNISDFDSKFKLLFGENHRLYDDDTERQKLLRIIYDTISALRNASFHFKNIQGFNKALEDNLSTKGRRQKGVVDKIIEYTKVHQQKQHELLIADLKAANVEDYLSQLQLDYLFEVVCKGERELLDMPKFSKLLLRAGEIGEKIISPVNATAMEHPAYQCCFISLKMLYDQDFVNWLKKQSNKNIASWMDSAKTRATNAAKKIFRNGTNISSKMARLRNIVEDETLVEYFSFITAETANEFQVQQQKNRYQSNSASAKEQSNFVEQFKQDFLIYAFKGYIGDIKFGKLDQGEKLLKCNAKGSLLPENNRSDTGAEDIERPWLYLVLHLVPIEVVNRITLQIKKHSVLTNSTLDDTRAAYTDIHQAFSLYLGVHGAILGLQSLSNEPELQVFFEKESDFNNLFTDNGEGLVPVKGLRDILRFGNLEQLKKMFSDKKVASDDITNLKEYLEATGGKSKIARAQEKRIELHKTLTELPKRLTKPRVKQTGIDTYEKNNNISISGSISEYRKDLKCIVSYRELKNKIYLYNVKQAHQLIMATQARLLGYSQIRERDLYFVLLTQLMLRGVTLEKEKKKKDKDKLNALDTDTVLDEEEKKKLEKQIKPERSLKDLVEKGLIFLALDQLSSSDKDLKAIHSEIEDMFVGVSPDSDNRNLRNRLAHFKDLGNKNLINITSQINEVRKMMSYDRKLKNAVSKSMIDLFERYNLILSFKVQSHKLQLKNLKSKQITHLNNKGITENLLSDDYVSVIKRLLLTEQNPE